MVETVILTAWPAIERGGPWVLLTVVVWLLMTGRLVTLKAHERALDALQAGHDGRVADLKSIIATQQQTTEVLLRQKDELLAGARVSVKALDAVRRQAELGGSDDALVA